jgi:hypothetical protein
LQSARAPILAFFSQFFDFLADCAFGRRVFFGVGRADSAVLPKSRDKNGRRRGSRFEEIFPLINMRRQDETFSARRKKGVGV